MAKELPFFQFEPAQWMMGKIQRCSDQAKGKFMDLCSRYWNSECNYSLDDATLDCGNEIIKELLTGKVIKKEGDNITIKFLDDQFSNYLDTKQKRKDAAEKRWAKKNGEDNASAMQNSKGALQTDAEKRKEEDRKEKKRIEEKRILKNKYEEFENEVFSFTQYEQELLTEFLSYWTEMKPKGKKMRFEMQPTFDVSRRLGTWKKNDYGNNNRKNGAGFTSKATDWLNQPGAGHSVS